MLILTRRLGECIIFGNDIAVKIVGIDEGSGQVTLGTSAPEQVSVNRSEVALKPDIDKSVVVTFKRRKKI